MNTIVKLVVSCVFSLIHRNAASAAGICLISVSIALSFPASAQSPISPLDGAGDSYYYSDHYEIWIDRPAAEVWPHMLELGAWMPWPGVDETGAGVSEGQRIKLYDDFYIEVAKLIPERMLLLVNLPNTQEGEETRGIAMFNLREQEGRTLVSLYMSRVYYWFDPEPNALRARRETPAFAASRLGTYRDTLLARLRQLAEGDAEQEAE